MPGEPTTSWWLDQSALPDLYWARVQTWDGHGFVVLDCDGRTTILENCGSPSAFMAEDEYVPYEELLADGAIPADTRPPGAASDEQLLSLMIVRRPLGG